MGTFSLSMAVANNCGKLTAERRSTATFHAFPPLTHVSHLPWSPSFGTKRPWVQIPPPRLVFQQVEGHMVVHGRPGTIWGDQYGNLVMR